MRLVDGLYSFRSDKVYSNEVSLYTPRGNYARNYNQILDDQGIDFEMNDEFLEQFKTQYNEEYISKWMDNNQMRASSILDFNSTDDVVMMVVYSVILAVDKGYNVELCDNTIEHKKFSLRDFIIRR